MYTLLDDLEFEEIYRPLREKTGAFEVSLTNRRFNSTERC